MPQHTGDYVLTFTGGKFRNSHVQAVGDLLTVSVPQCVVVDTYLETRSARRKGRMESIQPQRRPY